MTQRFARFLLLFAALWLPVQTMAGMVMPVCGHGQEQEIATAATQDSAAAEAMPCHHEAMAADQAAADNGCDHCQTCQLASSGFMPSAALTAGVIPAEYGYVLPAIMAPRSHIAEPPQHPPRNSA
jgi:ABC-type nickel/cobalt efflux system permease component RcnA